MAPALGLNLVSSIHKQLVIVTTNISRFLWFFLPLTEWSVGFLGVLVLSHVLLWWFHITVLLNCLSKPKFTKHAMLFVWIWYHMKHIKLVCNFVQT